MEMTAAQFKEYLKTGQIVSDKKGKLKKGDLLPEYEAMLKGVHKVRQSKSRKDALKSGFRSQFEKQVALKLAKLGIKYEYETITFKYYLKPNSKCVCSKCGSSDVLEEHTYTPDFKIGNTYIEVKGRFVAKDRKKILAVMKYNKIKLIFLFQDENKKLSKNSKTTYKKWAVDNGFETMSINELLILKTK